MTITTANIGISWLLLSPTTGSGSSSGDGIIWYQPYKESVLFLYFKLTSVHSSATYGDKQFTLTVTVSSYLRSIYSVWSTSIKYLDRTPRPHTPDVRPWKCCIKHVRGGELLKTTVLFRLSMFVFSISLSMDWHALVCCVKSFGTFCHILPVTDGKVFRCKTLSHFSALASTCFTQS